ncbi:EutN/CcmL family microcompartment protein [Phosphitispora fastidiosa]|uniref:EutN/CcmL family microcompartment protein n=1 Tax=Phosphitispora fastidiosa TaxID=2837202 RepID=UPI001E5543DE|nr:EutN/CcmL family microcompartment protein [Phosphitispora fastidiosa]MBU7007116.1 ethanolamine utilization protein EutN [Phosphitispora fastidiosa]
MFLGKVVGNAWATRKEQSITGYRLLVVQPLDHRMKPLGNIKIVNDHIGAGVGNLVIVVEGSPARATLDGAIDASVIGIVDHVEIDSTQYTDDKKGRKRGD